MQVDKDAVVRQAFEWQVARVSCAVVRALAAALRRLRRRLIQDAGYEKKDRPQNLNKGEAKEINCSE